MTTLHIRTAAVAALLLIAAGCGNDPEPKTPPDVLLVVIDTLRADRLGAYGYERGTSPVIDDIAARGTVFHRASSQAPWTVPSMSSMITSRYLTDHVDHPDPNATTIAESFQKAGYRTLGAVANSLLDPGSGFERGFDKYVPREGPDGKRKNPGDFDAVVGWLEDPLAEALAARDENGVRPPLFLYVHPSDPHAPYRRRDEFLESLPTSGAPPVLPEGWQQAMLERYGPAPPSDDPGWEAALRKINTLRNAYDHEVLATDRALGRLLDQLEQGGVDSSNLLVAIVSDHGEGLWENVVSISEDKLEHMPPSEFFFGSHGYHLSEQALRTPFILSGPGVPSGRAVQDAVENVDLFPTLIRLCGLPIPGELHGIDLVPLLRGDIGPDNWRDETYAYVIHGVTVRDEVAGLKLVLPTPYGLDRELGHPQLFDLRADPLERENLFDERPEDVARLSERAADYLGRYETAEGRLRGELADEMRRRMQEMGYAGVLVGEDQSSTEDGDDSDDGQD